MHIHTGILAWLILTCLPSTCRAAIMADILLETNKQLNGVVSGAVGAAVIILGLFILVLGISYKRVSLTIVTSILLTQVFWYVNEHMADGYVLGMAMPAEWFVRTRQWITFLEENKLCLLVLILLLAFVTSTLVIALIKSVTLVILFVLASLAYTEGYHTKLLQKHNITNPLCQYAVYAVLLLILVLVYMKVPQFMLAGIFCLIGSMMVTYGIDSTFEMGWNTLEVLSTSLREYNTHTSMDEKAVSVVIVLFMFGVGAQFIQIMRIGK